MSIEWLNQLFLDLGLDEPDPADDRRDTWIRHACDAIHEVARRYPQFTTDEVWHHVALTPAEPRWMGIAMQRAASQGIIAPTMEFALSERPECHHRPVRVWTSTQERYP